MNNKMNHPLITVDGRTLMDRPLEPPNFVVDTLISQGAACVSCPLNEKISACISFTFELRSK